MSGRDPNADRNNKQLQDQIQKVLAELVTIPDNKYCADCAAAGPRWCSANLGVFICLKCSGIHRSLGVHISFVRSVTLDKWVPEHVENMKKMGNARAKEIWEANLPQNFRRPNESDGYALEQFIRNKYERKLYMKQGVTNPLAAAASTGSNNSTPQAPKKSEKDSGKSLLLLDDGPSSNDGFGGFQGAGKGQAVDPFVAAFQGHNGNHTSAPPKSEPTQSSDPFGSFTSASSSSSSTIAPPKSGSKVEQAFFDNGNQQQQAQQPPKPSKDSIMSLFSSPPPQQQMMPQQQQGFGGGFPGQQQHPQQQQKPANYDFSFRPAQQQMPQQQQGFGGGFPQQHQQQQGFGGGFPQQQQQQGFGFPQQQQPQQFGSFPQQQQQGFGGFPQQQQQQPAYQSSTSFVNNGGSFF